MGLQLCPRAKGGVMFRHALRCGLFAVAAILGPALATPAWAATGTVYVEIAKAGFIVGGGSGTPVFKGRRYPLNVGGLSFGATIGASSILHIRGALHEVSRRETRMQSLVVGPSGCRWRLAANVRNGTGSA